MLRIREEGRSPGWVNVLLHQREHQGQITNWDARHSQDTLHCPSSSRSNETSHIYLIDRQEFRNHYAVRRPGFGQARLTKDQGMGVREQKERSRLRTEVQSRCHGVRGNQGGSDRGQQQFDELAGRRCWWGTTHSAEVFLKSPPFRLNLIGRSGAPICWIGFRKNSAIRHQRIPATASLGWIAQYTLTMLTQVDKLEFLVLVDNCKSVSSQMPRLIHSIGQA